MRIGEIITLQKKEKSFFFRLKLQVGKQELKEEAQIQESSH